MRALVLGAAGFLGTNLVEELVGAGLVPICGRRKRTNVIPLRRHKVPLVLTDLDHPETLLSAMTDVDTVFHLAGHYPKLSLHKDQTIAFGLRQLRNVLDAAVAKRVSRLIYVSSTATVAPVLERPSREEDRFERPPGFGTYHDLKWRMEDMVLAEDRLETIVACPSACLGPWDLRVGTSALLVGLARGLAPVYPNGVVNLVDARDVACALRLLSQHSQPPRRLLLSAQASDLHSLLKELSEHYGVAPPPDPLPAEQARAIADAEELRCQGTNQRPLLSREIVDLIVHSPRIDASLAAQVLGLAWRPLSETIEAFDDWARRMRLIPNLKRDTPHEQDRALQAGA